ncbi:Probable GABA transporter 2 [Linum perenne]
MHRSGWMFYFVISIQTAINTGISIGTILLSGECLQIMYSELSPHGSMKLYEFIAIVTAVMMVLSQMPSFHSLRHINLVSLLLSFGYTFLVVAACIYAESQDSHKVFSAFTSLSIIAAIFGNGILPEIQATLAPPATGKMLKGLVYSQVAFEVMEKKSADPSKGMFSIRNLIPRIILRSLYMAACGFVAAMLPFFGDINGIVGAIGFIPLDFILPMLLYNITFKPSKSSSTYWINMIIMVVFTGVGLLGAFASMRKLVLDAHKFKIFSSDVVD